MRVETHLVGDWPKLAWLASFDEGGDLIAIFHGPRVETSERGCVAAAWTGNFDAWDFDRTDLVFGSGVRTRDDGVTFVASGTGMEPLWHRRCDGRCAVSNSLPALLAFTRSALRDDVDYETIMRSIHEGHLNGYSRLLPTNAGDVGIFYYHNLVAGNGELSERTKPDGTPDFADFAEYRDWLVDISRRLGENLRSTARRHAITPVVSLSKGYDSPAAATIARHAGCREAVTITRSTSLQRRSDSGAEIARILGMSCRAYRMNPRRFRHEEAVWAGSGYPSGLRWTVFDFPEPLTLLFHGGFGDRVWDRRDRDLADAVGDAEDLIFEMQLHLGLIVTYVPCWGILHAERIHALGRSQEMAPWTMHTAYDRPIARRLVEEAGVPRGMFACRKEVVTTIREFLWPTGPAEQESYRRFRRHHGLRRLSPAGVVVWRRLAWIENMLWRNVLRKFGIRRRWRPWKRFSSRTHLFHWANEELTKRYARALAQARPEAQTGPGNG